MPKQPPHAPASAEVPGPLRLQLLQNAGVHTTAGVLHPLSAKDAALLALLALDGPMQRSRVAALLWPDADDRLAHTSLRQRLFRLRRRVGNDLVLQGPTLALAAGITHDLAAPAGPLGADASALPGELLEGFEFDDTPPLADWVRAARERWRATRRELLATLAAGHEAAERIAAALPYAERLAHDEPLLEHAQRRLMQLHYRRGDRAAALAVFDRLSDTLLRELGEPPSAETRQLQAAITASRLLPVASPPPPVTVLRPPRLIGRDREWRALTDAWRAGLVVAVRGEPGIGKSRLLNEFTQAQGLRASAQARPGDAHTPYALLGRVLRSLADDSTVLEPWARAELARVLPEFGTPAPGALAPLRLREAVEHLLRRVDPGSETLSVGIDDLQFGDAASHELLQALIVPQGRVRWLLAWRSAELPPVLHDWLAALPPDGLHLCDLAPLDAPAAAELLHSLALPDFDAQAWGLRLHRHSGGSPLLLLETLRAVLREPQVAGAVDILPVPSSIAALIGQRIALLEPAALRLAQLAALAGPDFSLDLAAQVLQCHVIDLSAPWQALADAQLMGDSGFAHDLIAEVVMRSVPAPIARHLHADIARAGSAQAMPPARRAAHWREAGEHRTAAQAFIEAGRAAAHAGRVADRVALLEQAASCAQEAGDPALAFEALRWLVVGVLVGGAPFDLSPVFERMDTLAAGDFERGEAARMQAITAMTRFDHAGVIRATDHALACFAGCPTNADARLASLFAGGTRAVALARSGRVRAALHASAATLAAIRALDDPPWNLVTNGLAEHANVLNACNRRDEALRCADEALQLCRSGQHVGEENSVLRVGAQILLLLGRSDEARQRAAQAVALHERMGASRGVALQGQVVLGWACRDQGEYAQALRWLEDACEGLRQLGNAPLVAEAEHQLSLTWLHLGRRDRAEQALTPVPPGAPRGVREARALHGAWLAASWGEPLAPHRVALEDARQGGSLKSHERLMVDLLLALAEGGRELAPRCLALARRAARRQLPSIEVLALGHAAQALTHDDPPQAAQLAERVLDRLADVQPLLSCRTEPAWRALRTLQAVGRPAPPDQLARWCAWVRERAAADVPISSQAAFVERNTAHRGLLAAGRRAAFDAVTET